MIYLYLGVLAVLLLLLVASRRETPLSDREVSGALRPVRKAAVWLYRRVRGVYLRAGGRKGAGFPGSGAVEKDLALLDPSKGMKKKAALYYIDKLQNLLLFILAADLLAMAVWYSESQEGVLSEEGVIERPDYGAGDLEISVEVSIEGEDSSVGQYTVSIGARQYTEEETQALAEELFELLPDLIVGENSSLSRVTGDLNLITAAEGYPFRITWSSSRYEWVDSNGTVHSDLVEEDAGIDVTLTAKLTYEGYKYEQSYEIRVYPEVLSQEEQVTQEIQDALLQSEEESAQTGEFQLPEEVNGLVLLWEEVRDDTSLPLFGLILSAGAGVFLLSDRDLHDKVRKRERQMKVDYPQIVSKLVLFLGAGMSVRNAFARLGRSYLEERAKGGEKHYVYEEILLVCREMDSGISESAALAHFGRRCGTRQYTKLCSLLVQNLTKGNSALLNVLQEEADLAFDERKSLARQMGEEAGTRLLLPMILMLGVTLVIIMIPAYMSFT